MYYESDEKKEGSSVWAGAFTSRKINQARFELFQYLRRYCMQVQIAICTTLVLVTANDAKDFFLDATAVLFVIDIDNLMFRALLTSGEQAYFLETTKLSLDTCETISMQAAKLLHGLVFALEICVISIWTKFNGINGSVRSVADLPLVLTAVFCLTQVIIGTVVLYGASYYRNGRRWNAKSPRSKYR